MALKRMFCLLTGMGMLLSSGVAWSAEVHGRSPTQYQWFGNDYLTGNKQADFGEYLSLSVTKIDPAGKLSIQGYGRGTQDVLNGQALNGRFFLYADYSNLYDKADIRLGRRFVNYVAGSALICEGKIDLKNTGPIAFSVMGGA